MAYFALSILASIVAAQTDITATSGDPGPDASTTSSNCPFTPDLGPGSPDIITTGFVTDCCLPWGFECRWYSVCLEGAVPCGPSRYTLAYAQYHCNEMYVASWGLSSQSKS